jgi:hypothetical protein
LGARPRGSAAGSPTPFSAASRVIGLIAGPSQPSRTGICWVRPLSPVRPIPAGIGSPDMVLTRLQSAFASPPFSARSAPSDSGTFTSRDGSDLLPLRLPWLYSWVARFFGRPKQEVLRTLPDSPTPPSPSAAFALPLFGLSLLARLSRPARGPVLARSSNLDPSGPLRQSAGRNSPSDLTRFERGFYFASHRTVPYSRILAGATPPRGTGESCLPTLAGGRGPVDQLHRPFPGCPGLSRGRFRSFFHYRGHYTHTCTPLSA